MSMTYDGTYMQKRTDMHTKAPSVAVTKEWCSYY